MRRLFALACLCGLPAAEPLRIVAVEREGLPPFEDARRLYRLQGPARVSPGEYLELHRPGSSAAPGRLRVLRTTPEGVLALLDRRGDTYPLKGDVAQHWEVAVMPDLPGSRGLGTAAGPLEPALAVPREARALREPIFFLPGDATLSPLGRAKLQGWVQDLGQGQWTLEVPPAKGRSGRLVQARAKVLKAALETAGARTVQIRAGHAAPPDRPDRVWVQYREGEPAKASRTRKAAHGA